MEVGLPDDLDMTPHSLWIRWQTCSWSSIILVEEGSVCGNRQLGGRLLGLNKITPAPREADTNFRPGICELPFLSSSISQHTSTIPDFVEHGVIALLLQSLLATVFFFLNSAGVCLYYLDIPHGT